MPWRTRCSRPMAQSRSRRKPWQPVRKWQPLWSALSSPTGSSRWEVSSFYNISLRHSAKNCRQKPYMTSESESQTILRCYYLTHKVKLTELMWPSSKPPIPNTPGNPPSQISLAQPLSDQTFLVLPESKLPNSSVIDPVSTPTNTHLNDHVCSSTESTELPA